VSRKFTEGTPRALVGARKREEVQDTNPVPSDSSISQAITGVKDYD